MILECSNHSLTFSFQVRILPILLYIKAMAYKILRQPVGLAAGTGA